MAKKESFTTYKNMVQAVKNFSDEKIVRYILNAIGAAYIGKQITPNQMHMLFQDIKAKRNAL